MNMTLNEDDIEAYIDAIIFMSIKHDAPSKQLLVERCRAPHLLHVVEDLGQAFLRDIENVTHFDSLAGSCW